MSNLYKPEVAALVGRRVALRHDVDIYPLGIFPAGLRGTVERYIPGVGLYVHLDQYFPVLEEWSNRLELFDWDDPDYPLTDTFDLLPEER